MNFFVKDFDFSFGPWVINRRTGPGFFMAIVWFLVEIVHVFTVYDLSLHPHAYRELETDSEDELSYTKKPTTSEPSTTSDAPKASSDEDDPKPDEANADASDSESKPSEVIQVLESDEEQSEGEKPVRPVSQASRTSKLSGPEGMATNRSIRELLFPA